MYIVTAPTRSYCLVVFTYELLSSFPCFLLRPIFLLTSIDLTCELELVKLVRMREKNFLSNKYPRKIIVLNLVVTFFNLVQETKSKS